MIDEEGGEYPTNYLVNKAGLSGGWRGFSIAHELVDGDALVFQLIRPTAFKVIFATLELSSCHCSCIHFHTHLNHLHYTRKRGKTK